MSTNISHRMLKEYIVFDTSKIRLMVCSYAKSDAKLILQKT